MWAQTAPSARPLGRKGKQGHFRRARRCAYERSRRARAYVACRNGLLAERQFEARSVQIPTLPKVPQLRAWKLAFRDELASISRSPDEGSRWSLDVDKKSYTEFSNSGSFPNLVSVLAAASSSAMMGELGRDISLKKGQAVRKEQDLKGRQLLPLLYNHYRLSGTDGAIFEFQDPLNIEMKGGGIPEQVGNHPCRNFPTSRRQHLWDALPGAGAETLKFEDYERLPNGHSENTCELLFTIDRRHLDAKRPCEARDELSNGGGRVLPPSN